MRVDLILADGEALGAQLTRGEAEALELAEGDVVWIGPGPRARAPVSA